MGRSACVLRMTLDFGPMPEAEHQTTQVNDRRHREARRTTNPADEPANATNFASRVSCCADHRARRPCSSLRQVAPGSVPGCGVALDGIERPPWIFVMWTLPHDHPPRSRHDGAANSTRFAQIISAASRGMSRSGLSPNIVGIGWRRNGYASLPRSTRSFMRVGGLFSG